MKRLPLLLLVTALTAAHAHASDPIVVPSRIDAVKVFRSGALITRVAIVDLPAGTSEVIFAPLGAALDEGSIQVRSPRGVTVLSVNAAREFLAEMPLPPAYTALQEQIDKLQQAIRRDNAALEVLSQEEALLAANRQVGGQQQGVTVAALEAVSTYHRNRLTAIKTEKITLADRVEANGKQVEKLKRQQAELRSRLSLDDRNSVRIRLTAATAGKATLELSYLSGGASWTSGYDARVEELGQPLALTRKGDVRNRTGEDWERVKLTLSTGDPARDHSTPVLQPWWIDLQVPPVADMRAKSDMPMMAMQQEYVRTLSADALQTEVSDNLTTTEFSIAGSMDILADGKEHTVLLENLSVPAEYRYIAAPRQSPFAVLTATLREVDDLRLQTGYVSIYYGRTFVGRTYLQAGQVGDSLILSLGADEGIALERTLKKDESAKNFLGNKAVKTTTYAIVVRNNKKVPVSLTLMDQIPLSRNAELEVKSQVGQGGSVDAESGFIRWELELAPGAREEHRFSYELRYPKGQRVDE
jgi:uncharacterized protein (TIGR02231 family)